MGRLDFWPYLAVSALLFAGCLGVGAPEKKKFTVPPNFYETDVQPIFEAHCTECHYNFGVGWLTTGGGLPADSIIHDVPVPGLNLLTADSSYQSLVGIPSFEEPHIQPRWRVMAGKVDSSFLIDKLSKDDLKSGGRMPFADSTLAFEDINKIADWIRAGAPRR